MPFRFIMYFRTKMKFFTTTYHPTRTTFSASFTFSAKEKDAETGYSYFGSRYYNSDLSIWLSVDPMASKYPSLSPYVYCANNPVKLVDPNGEEILIYGATYIPGEKCNSTDPNIQKAWGTLNEIYKTDAGKDIINEMCGKDAPKFNITNDKGRYANAGDCERSGENITLHLNGQIGNIKSLSHELFHGYQYMSGQGGLSCHNEVEAQLFSFLVCGQEDLAPRADGFSSNYGKSYENLINGNYSDFKTDFNNLRDGFLDYSFANTPETGQKSGLYTNLKTPLGKNNQFLLDKYFQK